MPRSPGRSPAASSCSTKTRTLRTDEHHGGGITFANDGKILFTTGEHFEGTPRRTSRALAARSIGSTRTARVPTDNPFYDGAGPNWDSIWAYGLRNPFRAYYDSPTGRLFVGDVGGQLATSNEEVNLGVRGANYGWPNSEGPCAPPCTSPLYDYEHNGRDASVTGGFVYHGTQFPAGMQGSYFFGDYAQNWIKRLTLDANGNVTGVFNFEPASGQPDGPTGDIVYLTEGPDGALYYLDLGYSDVTGTFGVSKIRRIRYLQSNQAPIAVAAANPTSGLVPLAVTFSSAGSSDPEGRRSPTRGTSGTAARSRPSQSSPYVHGCRRVHGPADGLGWLELDVLDPDHHSSGWPAHGVHRRATRRGDVPSRRRHLLQRSGDGPRGRSVAGERVQRGTSTSSTTATCTPASDHRQQDGQFSIPTTGHDFKATPGTASA